MIPKNLNTNTKNLTKSRPINQSIQGQIDELKKLVKENLEVSKKLLETNKKISHWINFQRVWAVLKVLIILVPLVLGAIYLPPLLSQVIEPYRELLNFNQSSGTQNFIDQLDGQITQ